MRSKSINSIVFSLSLSFLLLTGDSDPVTTTRNFQIMRADVTMRPAERGKRGGEEKG